jgi:predicted TIM-barrel fold metal-dependent hydrolase
VTPKGAVDYWCNAFTPDRQGSWEEVITGRGLRVRFRTGAEDGFCEPDALVARFDELGVATAILPTADLAPHAPPDEYARFACRPEETEALSGKYPGRFAGAWSIDPREGMRGVRRAAEMLARPWAVALHYHTHSFDRAFDHADLYPYYALCSEARVPMVMQAGTSGGLWPSECGRPIGVDRPALYFPDCAFVLSHQGWPWVDEAIAMALKFPHVYLGTAVYPLRHWAPALRPFLEGAGRHKVLWGTGFPAAGHRHTLAQLDEAGLSPEVRAAYLGGTARRVFARLESIGASGPGPR